MAFLDLNIVEEQIVPLAFANEKDQAIKVVASTVGVGDIFHYQPNDGSSILSYPHPLLIELRSEYTIANLSIYGGFGNASNLVTLEVGTTPFNMTAIATNVAAPYGAWGVYSAANALGIKYIKITLNAYGRFPNLRINAELTGIAYVDPTTDSIVHPFMQDTIGVVAQPGGNDPVKLGAIFKHARFFNDANYNHRKVSGVIKTRWDFAFQGGTTKAKYQAFKDNGVKSHITKQFSPTYILNRNDFTTSFEGVANSTSSAGAGFTADSGTWGIIGEKGYCVSAVNTGSTLINILKSSTVKDSVFHSIQLTVNLGAASSNIRVIVRYSDVNNYVFVEFKGDGTAKLRKRDTGVDSDLLNGGNQLITRTVSSPVGRDVVIKVDAENDLEWYVDGQYGSYYSNSFNSSALRVAIGVVSGTSNSNNTDRFEVRTWEPSFKGIPWGADPQNPASWVLLAKSDFYDSSYFGFNGSFTNDIPFDTTNVNSNVPVAESGLGLATSYEGWNEPNKTWQGREGYHNPFEIAAQGTTRYDGHESTLGVKIGFKSGDSNSIVSTGGLQNTDMSVYRGMKIWAKEKRTDKKIPTDVLNFHYYSNTGGGQFVAGSVGISPEAANVVTMFDKLSLEQRKHFKGLPIWFTEQGYSTNQSTQRAPAIAGLGDQEEVQGIWNIRWSLISARYGFRTYFYLLSDEKLATVSGTGTFDLNGFYTAENSNASLDQIIKKGGILFKQYSTLFNGTTFKFKSSIDTANVWKDTFEDVAGNLIVFYWSPTSNNTILSNQTIALPTGTWASAKKYTFNSTGNRTENVISNTANITDSVGELPIAFYYVATTTTTTPTTSPVAESTIQTSIFSLLDKFEYRLGIWTDAKRLFQYLKDSKQHYLGLPSSNGMLVSFNIDGTNSFVNPSSGVSTFVALTDVPSSYTSQALKLVRVNSGSTTLEFFTPNFQNSLPFTITGDGTTSSFAFTDNFATLYKDVTVIKASTGRKVYPEIFNTANTTTIAFGGTIPTNGEIFYVKISAVVAGGGIGAATGYSAGSGISITGSTISLDTVYTDNRYQTQIDDLILKVNYLLSQL